MSSRAFLLSILLGTLTGLALVAAWLAPAWLEVERFRPQLTAVVADALGRPVDIEGRLSITLLPRPTVTLRGVRLAGEPAALLEVAAVEAGLDPAALLRGEAEVTALTLDRPLFAGAALAADAPGLARRASAGQGPQQVLLRNGSIVVSDEDRSTVFAGLQAEITAAAIGAPYRIKGEVRWRGLPLSFDGSLGLPSAAATPFTVALRLADSKAEAKLSGQLAADAWHGRLTVQGGEVNTLLRRLEAGFVVPAAKADLALTAEARYDGRELRLDTMDLRLGESRAGGSIALTLGEERRGTVVLSFAALDLDSWLAGAPAEPAPPQSLAALLRGLPLTLDITADTMVLRQGLLRQVRLEGRLENGVARLGHVSALLPGNSMALGSGDLVYGEAEPRFDLSFDASSDNLRVALAWAGLDPRSVPADRLRVLAASGRLAGTARELHLTNLDLRVDTAHVTGGVSLRRGERLGLGLNLTAPALNLDAYGKQGAAPLDLDGLRRLLTAMDVNIRAAVGQFTLGGTTLRDVVLDGTALNGAVTLRQASTSDILGAAVRLDGGIGGLGGGAMPELRELAFDVRSAQPERLLRHFGMSLPFLAERLGGVALRGRVDGDARLLALDLKGEAAGGGITLAGSVTDILTTPRWTLQTEIYHDNLATMVRLALPDYRPLQDLGGFRLRTQVTGTAAELAAADLTVQAGPAALQGMAYLGLSGTPVVTASLSAGPLDLGPFLPARAVAAGRPGWSRDTLDLAWLQGWQGTLSLEAPTVTLGQQRLDRLTLRLAVADGAAVLEQAQAGLGDGRLTAQGRIAADGTVALQADLAEATLAAPLLRLGSIELAGGRIDATLQIKSEGRSPHEMVSRLAGSARLKVSDGVITGLSLGTISQSLAKTVKPRDIRSLVQAGMSGGRTPITWLAAGLSINAGVVGSDDIAWEGEGGSVTGALTGSLPAETIDARLGVRLTDREQAPGFVLSLEGAFDRPRRNFDLGDLEAWAATRQDAAQPPPLQDPPPPEPAPQPAVEVIGEVSRDTGGAGGAP